MGGSQWQYSLLMSLDTLSLDVMTNSLTSFAVIVQLAVQTSLSVINYKQVHQQ
jgi:hypothetical protein